MSGSGDFPHEESLAIRLDVHTESGAEECDIRFRIEEQDRFGHIATNESGRWNRNIRRRGHTRRCGYRVRAEKAATRKGLRQRRTEPRAMNQKTLIDLCKRMN